MKEFYVKTRNVFDNAANTLGKRIKEDFEKNRKFSNVLSLLIFNENYKGGNMFDEKYLNGDYQSRTFDYIDNINFDGINISDDSLSFFSSVLFDNYDDVNKYPKYYYICDKKFVRNIDKLLVNFLKEQGFSNSNKDILEKEISDDFKIIVNSKFSRIKYGFEHPADYYPPKILFGIKEEEVNINLSYNFSNYLTVINQGLFNLFFFRFDKENREKYIEPIAFFDEETKKYSLQNSHENLVRFNKFIHIYVELYKHYFAVFFDWVIEEFEPEIKDVLKK